MSTGMTTSTHSSSNKPSTGGSTNGARNGHKNDASLRPLLSNSISVSIASSENGMRKLSNQQSVASSDLI
jgi:hypothetical protein